MEYSREQAKEIILKELKESSFIGMKNTEFNRRLMAYEIQAQVEQMIKEGKLKL